MERLIMLVDMDAFFASVEQQANPALRGRPVAVIGSGGRTVVTTRSYEARKYSVKTGMNIWEAKKVCPDLIFVIGNNEKYTHTCRELLKIYLMFTPDVEVYSIDEAFLDITTTHHLFGGPEAAGISIKQAVKKRFGINCTVGIGPNILLAKLGSNLAKPDGLMRIRAEDAKDVLEDLPVKELWGIGTKTEARLACLGIRTCGELGRAPVSLLRNKFGIAGETLKEMGMGVYRRPVIVKNEDPKSIGHSMTLPHDIRDRGEIEANLLKLSEMVGRRARRHEFMGKTVSLVVRYADFETFSRQSRMPNHTNQTHVIYKTALKIFDAIKLRHSIRLLGVSLSSLVRDPLQMPLLEEERKRKAILYAMDAVNEKFGDFSLTWASYIEHEQDAGVISPAWRPSGVRHVNLK